MKKYIVLLSDSDLNEIAVLRCRNKRTAQERVNELRTRYAKYGYDLQSHRRGFVARTAATQISVHVKPVFFEEKGETAYFAAAAGTDSGTIITSKLSPNKLDAIRAMWTWAEEKKPMADRSYIHNDGFTIDRDGTHFFGNVVSVNM